MFEPPGPDSDGIIAWRGLLRVGGYSGVQWREDAAGVPRLSVSDQRFVRRAVPGSWLALYLLRRVKGRRTEYDHFMLGIHDRMKADRGYQSPVSVTQVVFPPGSTWACFTDRVSHAAMSGQFVPEQTFYLPVSAMKDPWRTPLRVLERAAGRTLVPASRVRA